MIPRPIDRFILHLAVAVNTLGVGVVLGLLAELQDEYSLPTAGLGLIAGASFITSFLAYVWLARYADRGHAKVMLLAGTVGSAAALTLAAFAADVWTFAAARALLGLAEGAFVPAARRYVLDWSPDRPGEVLGRILAVSVGGFALGPLVGAVLAEHFGLQVPFLVPAAILLVAFPVVVRLRPSTPIHYRQKGSFARLLTSRAVVAGVAIATVDFASIGAFDAIWARLLTDQGASTMFVGFSFLAISLPFVALASSFGKLADRISPIKVGAMGMVGLVVGLLGYGWLASPLLLVGAGIAHGVGTAAIAPVGASLVAAGSPPGMVARGQGLLEAVGFLAAAAATLPAGWLYQEAGRAVLWSIIMAYTVGTFLFAAWMVRPRPLDSNPAI